MSSLTLTVFESCSLVAASSWGFENLKQSKTLILTLLPKRFTGRSRHCQIERLGSSTAVWRNEFATQISRLQLHQPCQKGAMQIYIEMTYLQYWLPSTLCALWVRPVRLANPWAWRSRRGDKHPDFPKILHAQNWRDYRHPKHNRTTKRRDLL